MNKIITAIALVAASSALASATTVTVDLVSLANNTGTNSQVSASSTTNSTLSAAYKEDSALVSEAVDATSVATYLTLSTGLYYGFGNVSKDTSASISNCAATVSTESDPYTFTTTNSSWTRTNYYGNWAALVVSVSDILSASDTATIGDLTTLSISTELSGTAEVSAWLITDGTAVSITDGIVSDATEDSTIVVLVSSGTGAYSATVSVTTTIPEPSAFGLLAGIGALALVVSRRRRSR